MLPRPDFVLPLLLHVSFQNKSQAIAAEYCGPRDGMEKHFGEHSGGEDENQFVGPANGAKGE